MVGRIVGVLGPEGRMWVSVGFAVSQPMGAIPSVQELLHVPSEAFSLKTWNDALAYLTGLSQQADASAAKETLMKHLSEHCSGLQRHPSRE